MTYLDKLIEAVGRGRVIFLNVKDVCKTLGWTFPDTRIRCVLAAELGSLDAAKSLHDALLPGWGYRVSPCYAAVMHPSVTGNDVTKDAVVNGNPARAWLIAILKAYREETQK